MDGVDYIEPVRIAWKLLTMLNAVSAETSLNTTGFEEITLA